jgi:murein DD-endopeptidase MepM/ murein hydrolase activator NlpD
MRAVVKTSGRQWSRLALLGAVAVGVAGCSSDTTRFGNPNSNPFEARSAPPSYERTGSVQPVPSSHIAAQPLPPPPSATRPGTVAPVGVSGGGGGLGTYTPSYSPPAPAPMHAAAPPPAPAPSYEVTGSVPHHRPSGWNWDGGTAIMVTSGETATSLANKYGVPVSAIMEANGLHSPSEIHAGQRLVIPKFNHDHAVAAAAPPPTPHHYPTPRPAETTAGAKPNVHIVARGETLMSISRHYHKPVGQIAAANNIPPQTHLKIGDRIVIPGMMTASRSVAPPPAPAAPKIQPPPHVQAHAPPPAPQPIVTAEASPTAHVAMSGAPATAAAAPSPVAKALAFRWPVRGRVIATFGQKNGQRNDGIDLAVPQGTEVRAAEDGVVAYAGNELKGYGNLVLIRHENGFVTAYANTSEIMVKRNDHVHRGQVIAKSGQTGGVQTPQLHFEIRKGSSPVDPSQFLPTGGA